MNPDPAQHAPNAEAEWGRFVRAAILHFGNAACAEGTGRSDSLFEKLGRGDLGDGGRDITWDLVERFRRWPEGWRVVEAAKERERKHASAPIPGDVDNDGDCDDHDRLLAGIKVDTLANRLLRKDRPELAAKELAALVPVIQAQYTIA